jgi:septum formation protein
MRAGPDSGRLVLASASPRRLDLLRQAGAPPDLVVSPDIDETPAKNEPPVAYARRVAEEKARVVWADHPDSFVLAADTVVVAGRRILPKADTVAVARDCLRRLSGRRHRVLGAVSVIAPDGVHHQRLVTTIVTFKQFHPAEIDRYIATGEWEGKAGGYAIQGRAAVFVRFLSGSYTNVVGLPLFETWHLLAGLGYRPAEAAPCPSASC